MLKQYKINQFYFFLPHPPLGLMNGHHNNTADDNSQFNGEKNGTNGTHENEPPAAALDEAPPMVAAAEWKILLQ